MPSQYRSTSIKAQAKKQTRAAGICIDIDSCREERNDERAGHDVYLSLASGWSGVLPVRPGGRNRGD
jgi:hypothetical protein